MTLLLTQNLIRQYIGSSAYAKGAEYSDEGRVIAWDQTEAGAIHAKVRGNQREPYSQKIYVNGKVISGSCNCPVGYNCKHVAAVLIEIMHESQVDITSMTAKRPPPRPVLPYELSTWLQNMKAAQTKADEISRQAASRADSNAFIVYLVSPLQQYQFQKTVSIKPCFTQFRKDGAISRTVKNIDVDALLRESLPAVVTADDAAICKLIKLCKADAYSPMTNKGYSLTGPMLNEVLDAMLATNRVRLEKTDGLQLIAGTQRGASFTWQENDDGDFKLSASTTGGSDVICANPPLYLDRNTGELGRLDFGLTQAEVTALSLAPPIKRQDVEPFREVLKQSGSRLAAIAPPEPTPVERITGKPVPHLELFGLTLKKPLGYSWSYPRKQVPPGEQTLGLARISFEYPQGISVSAGDSRTTLRKRVDSRLIEIIRDTSTEKRFLKALSQCDLTSLEMNRYSAPVEIAADLEPVDGQDAWPDFMAHELPKLRAAGWQISVAATFPSRIVEADGNVALTIREASASASGIDWFTLDCGVVIEGVAVDLTETIAQLIMRSAANPQLLPQEGSETYLLPLPDGRYLSCPPERIRAMIAGLVRLFEGRISTDEGKFRFQGLRSSDLAALEADTKDLGVALFGGERLRELGAKLQNAISASGTLPQIPVPKNFRAELRSYQQTGFNWLSFLKDADFGCILADDMGLGKTIQALALLTSEKSCGRMKVPALVIAPTSVVGNWQREAEHFAPNLNVLVLQGLQRSAQFSAITDHDVVITSYPLLARDHEILAAQQWSIVVMDEAQYLKNPDAESTKRATELKAQWRVALSGTPVQNNLMELWSLFNLVNPGFLGDRKSFQSYYRNPIEKKSDKARSEMLARRVRPFILRRTKAEVARDLPAKTEITDTLELGAKQRDDYEIIRLAMQKKVREALAAQGLAKSHIIILDALLKLRQAALDPRLLANTLATKPKSEAGSAKLIHLMELLATLGEENRRVIVFSQFTSMLDLIEEQLVKVNTAFLRLDGKTKERTKVTRAFQEENAPVFLVSLKAGGVGLNLTAADTVILFDPWWNPAVEDQAIDRVHRIGQDKPVFVHRLIATNTIEEKMDTLKQKKRRIADSIFDADGQITGTLTEADIEALLA